MVVRAPAKLNLCLYLGRAREDGLHELRSLFCPLALSDRITVTTSDSDRDEVVCEGVEGPNLAEAALASLRERGWKQPAASDRDRQAHPGRGGAWRGKRRRRGDPAPRGGRGGRAG